jgi:hypothetical protein
LFFEGFLRFFLVEGFLSGEDGFVVVAAVFDDAMDDASQFMTRGRDGFGGSKSGFHSSEVVARGALAAVQTSGGHAQGAGGAAFDIAGDDRAFPTKGPLTQVPQLEWQGQGFKRVSGD